MPATKKTSATKTQRTYQRKKPTKPEFAPTRPSVVAEAKAEVKARNRRTFTTPQLVVAVVLAISITTNVAQAVAGLL